MVAVMSVAASTVPATVTCKVAKLDWSTTAAARITEDRQSDQANKTNGTHAVKPSRAADSLGQGRSNGEQNSSSIQTVTAKQTNKQTWLKQPGQAAQPTLRGRRASSHVCPIADRLTDKRSSKSY